MSKALMTMKPIATMLLLLLADTRAYGQAKTNLGDRSWTLNGFGSMKVPTWVMSESEWRSVLKNADDQDFYVANLQGFLEVATDPDWVGRKTPPNRQLSNFKNELRRAPNAAEKGAFVRALYGLRG